MLSLAIAAPFVVLAVWNIWSPYSYWLDEIFSVAVSSEGWAQFRISMLNDVHPPLYQTVLKGWIFLFGTGETQTRSLSLVFSLVTLASLLRFMRDRDRVLAMATIAFFVSSFLFVYYSQETRSYAMLLMFSTLGFFLYMEGTHTSGARQRTVWYLLLLALSLTHYFGLVLAGILLLADLVSVRHIKGVIERVLVGAVLLVYPLIHLSFGGVLNRTGGRLWITSDGIHSTLLTFSSAHLRPFHEAIERIPYLSATAGYIALAAGILALLIWFSRIAGHAQRRALFKAAAIVLSFVAVMAAIDLHTPMSTRRNYIVLLPPIALMYGLVVQAFWNTCRGRFLQSILILAVTGHVLASAYVSYRMMENRWAPRQDWKGLAEIVQREGLCSPHCWYFGGPGPRMYAFYFAPDMGPDPAQAILSLEALVDLPVEQRRPVIAVNIWPNTLQALRAHYTGWSCLAPPQSRMNGAYILVKGHASIPGLEACPDPDQSQGERQGHGLSAAKIRSHQGPLPGRSWVLR